MQIMNVAVIGSGTMGSGIAQVAATAGCSVKIYDTNAEALLRSQKTLDSTLLKLVEKGKIDAGESSRISLAISYVSALEELHDADLIIEAIVENIAIKKKLFSDLEAIVRQETILASNTSSLSIASIASTCTNP